MIEHMPVRPAWLDAALDAAPARPTLEPLAVPLHRARRRVATLSAWAAVVAVAGLSLALRRRRADGTDTEQEAAGAA
jgi:hypothetical protein